MIAGTLEIQLLANMARLQADMDAAKKAVGGAMAQIEKSVGFAKDALVGLASVGIVAAFAAQVKGAIDLADSLNKLSQRTGIATEQLSQLQYAAKLADVSNETLTGSIRKLNISIAEGLAGDKEKIALFKALGITQRDLGKGTQEVMLMIADAYSKAADGAGKVAVGNGLMGKSADEMIPLLNGGRKAIEDLMKEAEKLGLTIGSDFAKQAEEFNDNLTKINISGQKLSIMLAGELVSGLGKAMKAFADATIEGNKLAGVIAFIQTLFTGDDMHKANVKLTESVDKLLVAEKMLAEAKAIGMHPAGIAAREKEVQRLKEEIRLTQNYRGELIKEKEAADAAAAAVEAARARAPNIKVPSTGETAKESGFESLNAELMKRKELLDEEIRTGLQLTESRKFEIEMLAKLTEKSKDWSEAKKQIIRDQIAEVKADMEVVQARKELDEAIKNNVERLLKEHQAIEEFDASRRQSIRETIKSQEDREQSLKDEIAAMKMAASGNISLAEAVERVAIARLREEQTVKFFENSAGWLAREEEIKQREKLLGLMKDKAVLDEWQKTTDSIRDGLTDALLRGFESGKGFARNLRDTLSNMFKTLVLRPVISAIFNPVAAGLAGMLGVTSAAQAAGSSSSGSAIGTFGGLASLFGSGGLGGSIMAGAGWLTGASTFGGTLTAAGSLIGTGTTGGIMSGLGMGVGALGPIVAGLALLSSLAQSFKGETRAGGQYGYAIGGQGYSARRDKSYSGLADGAFFLEGPSGGDPNQANALLGVNTAAMGINSRFAALGSSSRLTGFNAGYETSDKGRGGVFAGGTLTGGLTFGESGKGDNYAGTLFESTSTQSPDAKAAWENFTTDLLQASIQALQADSQLPESVKKIVKDVNAEALSTDAATQLLTQVDTMIAGVTRLREVVGLLPFKELTSLSFDAAQGLIELAGGIDNLTNQLGSFWQNYFTEGERQAQQLVNITNVLSKVNIAVPKSNEEFKALVLQFMAMGEAGQEGLAALLSVNQAFAELYPLATEATTALEDMGSALDDALESLRRAIDAEKDRLGIEKAVHQEALAAARAVYEISHSNAQQLYGMIPAAAAMSAKFGRAFVSNAASTASATGYLPDASALGEAVAAARGGLDSKNFKTLQDQQRATVQLANDLATLEKISGAQKTIAEQQLDALEAQIKALDDLYDQQEKLVKAAQGIDTSVLSVTAALQKLTDLMFPNLNKPAEVPSGVPVSGGPSTSTWNGRLAGSSSGFTIDANGFRRYDDGSGSMLSEGELDLWRRGLLGNVPVPSFDVGTPYVPGDGLAYLHKGEAVMPAPVAQRWRDTEGSSMAVWESIDNRLARLEASNESIALNSFTTKQNTKEMLDRGIPIDQTRTGPIETVAA